MLRIDVHLPDGEVQGTGFVVRADRTGTYVLTNRHVVEGATLALTDVLTPDGHTHYKVNAIRLNNAKDGSAGDLAILVLRRTPLHALRFDTSARLAQGQDVASIGYGLAFQLHGAPSVSTGVIAALGRNLDDGYGPVWIQHQSPINHGDSGGPLLNLAGDVVGVNTQSIASDGSADGAVQGVFLAIPSRIAQQIATQLIDTIHQGPTLTLNAARQVSSRVTIGSYGVTLPFGWFVSRLNRAAPVALSRDQLVQVSLRTIAVRSRPSTAQLAALIGRLASMSGHVKSIGSGTKSIGRLRGYEGIVTYTDKPYRLRLTVLPDAVGHTIYALSTFYRKGATATDRKQAASVVLSLQPLR